MIDRSFWLVFCALVFAPIAFVLGEDSQPTAPPQSPRLAEARSNRQSPPRKRFAEAKNYYCYYGSGQTEKLSHFDIAILHTPAMSPGEVKTLEDVGVVTLGYLTIGEDEKLRIGDGKGPGGKASWYFDIDGNGKADKNGTWNSYYANTNNAGWRADRLAEAHTLIDRYGFSGIFLDTVDLPEIYRDSRKGMVQLIKELRKEFPDKVIVANWSLPIISQIAPAIDAMMWEGFTLTYDFKNRKYIRFQGPELNATRERVENELKPARKAHPFRVLSLDYSLPKHADWIQDAYDRAVTFDFLPCVAPIALDRIYEIHAVGQPKEIYRKP